MRALTHEFSYHFCKKIHMCRRNEVLAREGIDTMLGLSRQIIFPLGRNEVLAREGIDTHPCRFLLSWHL